MPHIFLYGPSGTGKSAIGKVLAKNLGLPFVDLDSVIEANAGISIPQIMEQQGETCFRHLETAALKTFPPLPEDKSSIQVGTEPFTQIGTGERCKVKGCCQPVYDKKSGLCSYHRMKHAKQVFENRLRARQHQAGGEG